MVARLTEVAARGDVEQLRTTVEQLRTMMHNELESHFVLEETQLFPLLAKRGLAGEVGTALEQHGAIRRLRDELGALQGGDAGALRAWLDRVASELRHHVRFEADFLYVDLRSAEADRFRKDLDDRLPSPKQ